MKNVIEYTLEVNAVESNRAAEAFVRDMFARAHRAVANHDSIAALDLIEELVLLEGAVRVELCPPATSEDSAEQFSHEQLAVLERRGSADA